MVYLLVHHLQNQVKPHQTNYFSLGHAWKVGLMFFKRKSNCYSFCSFYFLSNIDPTWKCKAIRFQIWYLKSQLSSHLPLALRTINKVYLSCGRKVRIRGNILFVFVKITCCLNSADAVRCIWFWWSHWKIKKSFFFFGEKGSGLTASFIKRNELDVHFGSS